MQRRLSFNERLAELWYKEFYDRALEHCVLCGNTGMIHDRNRKPRYCCICPTGRVIARDIPTVVSLQVEKRNEQQNSTAKRIVTENSVSLIPQLETNSSGSQTTSTMDESKNAG